MAIYNPAYQQPPLYNQNYSLNQQPNQQPQYQYPYQQPQVQVPQQSQMAPSDTNMIWVQGESGAKAFPVQNGKGVILLDSEADRCFIKTIDINGMPRPLRAFRMIEEEDGAESKQVKIDTSQFITRDEFEDLSDKLDKIQKTLRKEEARNAKSSI